MPTTVGFDVDTICISYVDAGGCVLGTFQRYVPADVSAEVTIVPTTLPELRSLMLTWVPGLPFDDQVIECVLPRAHNAPVVGELTVMLLPIADVGPDSTKVCCTFDPMKLEPTALQLVELVQDRP